MDEIGGKRLLSDGKTYAITSCLLQCIKNMPLRIS